MAPNVERSPDGSPAGRLNLSGAVEAESEGLNGFDDLLPSPAEPATAARSRSWFGRLLWLLSLVPGVAFCLLISMAVRVRLADGVWPVRSQPDPKDLGLHNTVTVAAILVSFVVVLLVPLLALVGQAFGRRRLPIAPPLVGVASLALLFGVLVADIGGLGNWIGD